MGFFSRLFPTTQKAVNTNVFSFLTDSSAPEMKIGDYLAVYSGWAYACVNAIAEEVAATELTLQRRTRDGWTNVEDHLALGPPNEETPSHPSR